MAAALQRTHDRPFLLRRDAPEDRHLLEYGTELVGIVGELARVERLIGAGDPDAPGDRAHRVRVVAGDDHAADALLREVAQGIGGVGPDLLLEHEDRRRDEPVGQLLVDERGIGVREEQDPLTLGGEAVGFRAHRIVRTTVGPHHLGRAQHPRAAVSERHSTPFAAGRERRRPGADPSFGFRKRVAQRIQGRIAIVVGSERAQRLGYGIVRLDLLHVSKLDHALGERAGLVEQDDVDAGQSLDRRELLHQHLPTRQRDGGDPECEAREQDQPFGHHRDDPGDDSRDRGAVRVLHPELAEREQHRGR